MADKAASPVPKLTRRQQMVMFTLYERGEMSAQQIENQYLGVSQATARSIFHSLANKGLVDVAGFTSSWLTRESRTYKLTAEGCEVVVALSTDDAEGDEAE